MNNDLISRSECLRFSRPQGERADRALAIIDRLRTDGHINNKEQGTLRRAILLPERLQGEWKQISPAKIYECSLCHKTVMTSDIEEYHFCHGCGADMRSKKEGE